jgi:ATP-dependent Lon protease
MVDDNLLLQEIQSLKGRVEIAKLPVDLKEKIDQMIHRFELATQSGSVFEESERISHYIDWVTRLPWDTYTVDNLDVINAKSVLDKHHYGLEDVKQRLLEYLSVLKLNRDRGVVDHIARAPILLLVGLVGTGKTTFAYSLAEAMNRKIVRIPFGSMGSALDLRGQSRLHLEAEPGYIIKALQRAGTKNPIILLDEIDRVTENAREDIMGVLVELLDPEQNHSFLDHYLDYPFDLSQVLFIGTANGTSHIATAVMDRMEPISMPSYTDEEKMMIAKNYILPKIIKETALPDNTIQIDENIWPLIVRPLGYDAGIRTLQRTLQGIVRKIAREFVEGKLQTIQLTADNIKTYLPSYKSEII